MLIRDVPTMESTTSKLKVYRAYGTNPVAVVADGSGAPYGESYDGDLFLDKKSGTGTYTYPNGNKYVGDYKDDRMEGQGTYTYANGEKYVGRYSDGRKEGSGIFTYSNGERYIGEWKDDI